jgi:hypothetical protein
VATASAPDDGIPVLTDVVDAAAAAAVAAQRPAPSARPAGAAQPAAPQFDPMEKTAPLPLLNGRAAWPDASAGPPSVMPAPNAAPSSGPPTLSEFPDPPGTLSTQSYEELAGRVHAAVLEGLLARIEPMVEARLKESIADLLEKVLANMTAELRVSARNIVRDAVARGVVDEINALRGRTRPRK